MAHGVSRKNRQETRTCSFMIAPASRRSCSARFAFRGDRPHIADRVRQVLQGVARPAAPRLLVALHLAHRDRRLVVRHRAEAAADAPYRLVEKAPRVALTDDRERAHGADLHALVAVDTRLVVEAWHEMRRGDHARGVELRDSAQRTAAAPTARARACLLYTSDA